MFLPESGFCALLSDSVLASEFGLKAVGNVSQRSENLVTFLECSGSVELDIKIE